MANIAVFEGLNLIIVASIKLFLKSKMTEPALNHLLIIDIKLISNQYQGDILKSFIYLCLTKNLKLSNLNSYKYDDVFSSIDFKKFKYIIFIYGIHFITLLFKICLMFVCKCLMILMYADFT